MGSLMMTTSDAGRGMVDMGTDNDVGAGAPLPWNDPEYVRFVQALDNSRNLTSTDGMQARGSRSGGFPSRDAAPSEVYQSLIQHERRALDTVDRVVNDARKTALASTQLVDMPVRALAYRAMATGRSVMDDLLLANSTEDVTHALVSGDRKVFLGAALIVIAIAAALVTSFSSSRV